jgi:glutathione synthase/RimK-type ligase-like ATP-grasp enzyme
MSSFLVPRADAPIALLTDARFVAQVAPPGNQYLANILEEDRLLAEALARRGVASVRLDWADPDVDWSQFRAAVFRTTWDYFDRIDAFRAWMARVEQETRLLNAPSLVRWNLDKHYFRDLEDRGLPVIPTLYLEPLRGMGSGDHPDSLASLLEAQRWPEGVVKPCIAGGARLTYRVTPETAPTVDAELREARTTEAFMLQPFLSSVLEDGEVTLVLFDGKVTHAVRKRAKAGDFRVQDDHGGTVHPHTPLADERAVAEAAWAALDPAPAYGRIDLVRDEAGIPRIMELELIEPELWLRFHPAAADAFAEALVLRLQRDRANLSAV